MPDRQPNKTRKKPQRFKLTARVSLAAYDAIYQLQRQHRRKTGKHNPRWKILDEAIRAYAEKQGIAVEE